jgi:hypothetical protein
MAVAALDGVKLDLFGRRNVLVPDAAERWFNAIDAEIFALGRFPERCPWAGEDEMLGTNCATWYLAGGADATG